MPAIAIIIIGWVAGFFTITIIKLYKYVLEIFQKGF